MLCELLYRDRGSALEEAAVGGRGGSKMLLLLRRRRSHSGGGRRSAAVAFSSPVIFVVDFVITLIVRRLPARKGVLQQVHVRPQVPGVGGPGEAHDESLAVRGEGQDVAVLDVRQAWLQRDDADEPAVRGGVELAIGFAVASLTAAAVRRGGHGRGCCRGGVRPELMRGVGGLGDSQGVHDVLMTMRKKEKEIEEAEGKS